MKYLLSIGSAGLLCCLALFIFWQAHVQGISTGSGALSAQLDELAAAWTAKNTPVNDRMVVLVISDAESADDPLALAKEPSVLDRMKGWFRRTVLGKTRAAEDSRFARAFAGDAATILWTQASFPTAEEEDMVRGIKAAIVKAHDAGAELDIVTQGLSAGPVLKAVKSLEGTTRGGEKVGVNKLVTVGMNWPTLNRIDPFFKFGRPENLLEWAAIWTTNSLPKKSEIAIFSAGANDALYAAEELYPAWSAKTEDVARVIKSLINSPAAMRRQLALRAPAPKTATWKNHQGFYSQQPVSAAGAPAAPASPTPAQDSLAMITGGSGVAILAGSHSGGVEKSTTKADRRGDAVRLTTSKYFGYAVRADAIWKSATPKCPVCRFSQRESAMGPPLDNYPEEWAWIDDQSDFPPDATQCPPEVYKNLDQFQGAVGMVASRGKIKLASCAESYPIACCGSAATDAPAR